MKAAVKKEFAKFLFQRMSKEKAVGLINSFPLLEAQKKILIEVDVLKIPQKQIAWQEGREVKTISRRYNKALEMSSDLLTAYISRLAALDKQVAVDKQATVDNFAYLNNRIDTTRNEILCYCNATFVPGKLVMPLDNLCPAAMPRYNDWKAPTESTTPAA